MGPEGCSPPQVDRTNKIPIYTIFHLLRGDYNPLTLNGSFHFPKYSYITHRVVSRPDTQQLHRCAVQQNFGAPLAS